MNRYIIGPDGKGGNGWKSTRISDEVIVFTGSKDLVISQTQALLKLSGGGQISLQGSDGDIKDNYNV